MNYTILIVDDDMAINDKLISSEVDSISPDDQSLSVL